VLLESAQSEILWQRRRRPRAFVRRHGYTVITLGCRAVIQEMLEGGVNPGGRNAFQQRQRGAANQSAARDPSDDSRERYHNQKCSTPCPSTGGFVILNTNDLLGGWKKIARSRANTILSLHAARLEGRRLPHSAR